MLSTIKHYYALTKPGIIYGNLVTTAAGFLLAAQKAPSYPLLFETLLGIALVIAGGCVINNIIDRDIDSKMQRTENREMVRGVIRVRHAYVYGILLSIIGAGVLFYFTNLLALTLGMIGLFVYVFVYTLWTKRHSTFGTLLGSISGAMPIMVGYTTVSGEIDGGALLLFVILALWQMPHSYAIAIYRLADYKNAAIPVLPLVRGMRVAKQQIVGYTLLFFAAILALWQHKYVGNLYLLVLFPLTLGWLIYAIRGLATKNNELWAKRMFLFSIVMIMLFSLLIAIDTLPH